MATARQLGPYTVEISSPEKILFADSDITKGDLIDYYRRIAATMLPHVRDRIVTMHRFPDGIDGKDFYQKDVPDYFPDWIKTVTVKKEDGELRQVVIENAATLVYLANQACIAIHVWPSRIDERHRPDRLIFDLDPSSDDFEPVRNGARSLRHLLEQLGLAVFVMTTGSRGLHVVAPLDRGADFDTVRDFARRTAAVVAARDPEHLTTEARKDKRGDRVFIDCMRNAYAQHAIAPYSARAKPGAPVATPIDWNELGNVEPRKYTLRNIFRRLGNKDDPWKNISRHARSLSGPMEKIGAEGGGPGTRRM